MQQFLDMFCWLSTFILQKYMCSRKQILQKIKLLYNEVKTKRKNLKRRLQVNDEFQQVKIRDLND